MSGERFRGTLRFDRSRDNSEPPLPQSLNHRPSNVGEVRYVGRATPLPSNTILDDVNARPAHFRNLFKELVFIFTVMLAVASTTFLQGAIVINTAGIAADLKMTPTETTWITAAIGLTSGAFMLPLGKTADLLGRKLQMILGMVYLGLCSLSAAFAPSAIPLNVMCGLLGIGTAILSPPAVGLLLTSYPEGKRRNRAMGALGCGNPIGFVLGSISSGVFASLFNWRAAFIVIAGFFSILAGLAIWTMPVIKRIIPNSTQMRRFDYVGAFLIIFSMALITAGLTEGPEIGWRLPSGLVVVGLVSILGFMVWERYYTNPLLDPVVWRNQTFTFVVFSAMLGYMSFITNQFWISLYLQDVQQLAPLQVALRLLPQTIAGCLWSYIGQYLVSRLEGSLIMGLGGVAYLTGAILIYFIKETSSYWALLFPSLLITVMGADFQFIVANLYLSNKMPSQASLAAGVLQTAMRFAISLGLAITNVVVGSASKSLSTPVSSANPMPMYTRAFACSVIFALCGLVLVPFMDMSRQGDQVLSMTENQPSGSRSRFGGSRTSHMANQFELQDMTGRSRSNA